MAASFSDKQDMDLPNPLIMENWPHHSGPQKRQRCHRTSVLGKTAERMVANRLTTFLEEKKIICPQQAAYRKNMSTIDQVAYIAQKA
jgi:hypothetical protein